MNLITVELLLCGLASSSIREAKVKHHRPHIGWAFQRCTFVFVYKVFSVVGSRPSIKFLNMLTWRTLWYFLSDERRVCVHNKPRYYPINLFPNPHLLKRVRVVIKGLSTSVDCNVQNLCFCCHIAIDELQSRKSRW